MKDSIYRLILSVAIAAGVTPKKLAEAYDEKSLTAMAKELQTELAIKVAEEDNEVRENMKL